MRFDVREPPPTRRFGTVEPPRTQVKEVYLPCKHCEGVGRAGSRRFAVLEPPPTRAFSTLHTL